METRLEEYIPNRESNTSIIGWAKICLAGKMTVILTILKGQRGVFAKFPSVKIAGEFRNAISWPNSDVEKKIIEAIMPEITKKIEASPVSGASENWF